VKALRIARAEAGITLVELAEKSGVSRHTISEIEQGARKPRQATLTKLAKALDRPVSYFLEEHQVPAAQTQPPNYWLSEATNFIDWFNRQYKREALDYNDYAYAVGAAASLISSSPYRVSELVEEQNSSSQSRSSHRTAYQNLTIILYKANMGLMESMKSRELQQQAYLEGYRGA
jgi:transcriptional regulator with XRE-family HTH domain